MGKIFFLGGSNIDQPEFVDVTLTTIGVNHTSNQFTFNIPNGRNGQLVVWLASNPGYTAAPAASAAGIAGTLLQWQSTGPFRGAMWVWDAPVTAVTTIGYSTDTTQYSAVLMAAFYKNVNQSDSYSGIGDETYTTGATVRINTSTTAEFRNGLYVMGVVMRDAPGTFTVSADSGLTIRASAAVVGTPNLGESACLMDKTLVASGLTSAVCSITASTSIYAAGVVLNGSTKGT